MGGFLLRVLLDVYCDEVQHDRSLPLSRFPLGSAILPSIFGPLPVRYVAAPFPLFEGSTRIVGAMRFRPRSTHLPSESPFFTAQRVKFLRM